MVSAPVFLGDTVLLAKAGVGRPLHLSGPEGRHAGVVQRRDVGERIDVVDGEGRRACGRISAVTADGVEIIVDELVMEAQPSPRILLVQALAKGDRDELAIEAATEVGVDGVVPWQAERSIVVWRGDRAAKSRARWAATVRTATKQSRRARVPDVEEPCDTSGLATRAARPGTVMIVLHEEATDGLVEVVAAAMSADEAAATEVLLVVGPEGGISDREVDKLTAAGARLARLGPHVLRTSTAGPVAIALLSHGLGRWA